MTLILDRVVTRVQEERALDLLLESVAREVATNKGIADLRKGGPASGSFEFYEALPTDSWTALRNSSIAWRLLRRRALFRALDEFYTSVIEANNKNVTARQFFALSQDVGDADAARTYLDKAMLLVVDPYPPIVAAANGVLALQPVGAQA